MKIRDYCNRAQAAYESGRVSEEEYNTIIMHADEFCDDGVDHSGLPPGYAEVVYGDFENAEAIDGARFADKLYQFYMER